MLTLDLTNAPRWHDLAAGVRLQLRPLTTALMVATRSDPAVEALPEAASDEERAVAFAKALARQAVLAWEGIGDADGTPIDPSPQAIDALLDIWPIFEAFQLILFVTDGEPSPTSSASAAVALRDTIPEVEVYGFNIELATTTWTAMLDTTPGDGVPVIAPGDAETLRDTALGALFGLPRHAGREVLIDPAVLRQPLGETLSQPFESVESGLGPIVFEPLRDLVARGSVLTLKDQSPARTWARRRWLHHLRGRAGAFWLPTWGRELELVADSGPGDAALIVDGGLLPSDWIARSLLFDLPDGPLFRRIESATYDPLGLRLTIAALDRAVPVGTPGHLMTLVRLDTDRVEFDHRPAGTEASLTVLEVPDEA